MGTSFTNQAPPHVRSGTLASQIVTEIRSAVFGGALQPGEFLGSEQDLASRYGVSRITARDALRSLSAMGIVTIRQGARGGATIAEANLEHFADALAVQFQLAGVDGSEVLRAQSAIEGMAAKLAALHHTKRDLSRLRAALSEASTSTDDPKRFTEASWAFHVALAEASNNRALVALLRALRHVVWPEENRRLTPPVIARVQQAHREIFARVEARDGDGARKAMSEHLGGIRSRIGEGRERVC